MTRSLGFLLFVSAHFSAPWGQTEATAIEDADRWIESGRALLAAQPEAAQAAFERASELEPGSLRTRMWILRSWMEQGRINDSLDGIDALVAEGERGAAIDYLYGMAWFLAAEAKLADGAPPALAQRNLLDAYAGLVAATRSDPELFGDALYPLAKVAWQSQRLDVALEAARAACAREPGNARAQHLFGRIARLEYEVARASPETRERALLHARAAEDAFERAAVLLTAPADRQQEALLAETHLELLHLHLALGQTERAAADLGRAVAWDPERIDYSNLNAALPPTLFAKALGDGVAAFESRFGLGARSAAVHWWLGYAHFRQDDYPAAERAFLAALARRVDLRSAWYYLGRLRFVQRDHAGAVEALRTFWEADPVELFSSLRSDPSSNVPMLDHLGTWCRNAGRVADATILFELGAELEGTGSAWRRLGMYLADQSKRLREREGVGSIDAHRSAATALLAFERALLCEPDSPVHALDLALHLHQALGDDLPRARTLYESARAKARLRLADPTLDEPTRRVMTEVVATADANLELLPAGGG